METEPSPAKGILFLTIFAIAIAIASGIVLGYFVFPTVITNMPSVHPSPSGCARYVNYPYGENESTISLCTDMCFSDNDLYAQKVYVANQNSGNRGDWYINASGSFCVKEWH
jgi:hypothetical protein